MIRLSALASLFVIIMAGAVPELVTPQRHVGGIWDLAVAGSGEWFATMGFDRTVRVWSLPEGVHLRTFQTPEVMSFAVHPHEAKIAIGTGFSISILDVDSGTTVLVAERSPVQTSSMAWTADGGGLLVGQDRLFRLDLRSGAWTEISNWGSGAIQRLLVLPRTRRAIVAWKSGAVLYDSTTWKRLAAFDCPGFPGYRFDVNPKESLLASMCADQKLRILSLENYSETDSIQLHDPDAPSAEPGFSSDGSTIGLWTRAGLQLYDTASRKPGLTLAGVYACATLRRATAKSVIVGVGANDIGVFAGDLKSVLFCSLADPSRI